MTTLAGSATSGFADGTGASAKFDSPAGVAVDVNGNVYVADAGNYRVRKVTPAGVVTTLAGSNGAGFKDGTGSAAIFGFFLGGAAVDASGNVYVGEVDLGGEPHLRKVSPAGVVTTPFEGNLAEAFGVAVGASGTFYGCDGYYSVWKLSPAGTVTTLAGGGGSGFADGTGGAAKFNGPHGVAVDATENLYVVDSVNYRIRKVTPAGVVTTIAGSGTQGFANGTGAAASFNNAYGIAVDDGRNLYVADQGNHLVRKIEPVGAGKLVVSWQAPAPTDGPPILGYVASASANGQTTRTCTTTSETTCTLAGLTSDVAYTVTVVATNAVGTSAPSSPFVSTPN